MSKIVVTLPGKGRLTFPDGTPDSVINETILREFPKDGSDVARMIAEDPVQAKKISDEDFVLYEDYLDKKKTDYVSAFAGGVSGIAETVGKGVAGIFQLRNLDPQVAASTAIEGAAQGTRDLYGMVAQSTDPTSYMFKFTNWLNGTGTVQDRKSQWIEANEFTERSERIARGEEAIVPGINPAFVNADVRNAIGLVADPSVLIPGLNVSAVGAKAVGAGLRAGGRVAQAVTRPLVSAIDRVGEVASEALGTKLDSVRNVAAGTGISGLALGVPGVSQAAAVIGGWEAVSKLGRVAEQAGEQLLQAPTRIGPLESIGRAPNATSIDRALGQVGRFGGDDLIDIGTRSLAGAVEGAAIGGGLGYLSQGEEGLAAGIGSGGVLGAGAAGLVRGVQKASGVAARQARENDYQIFRDGLDEAEQSKFDTIVKNSGIDGAVQVMDTAGIIRGKFNDAEIRFLTSEEFTKEHGANARGVKIVNVEAQRPVVEINVDKISSQRTAFHELFHVFKAIDNLRPAAEKVEQTIVGNWIIDKNGDSVQTSPGFMDEAQILSRFDEYVSKLADNDPNRKINTVAEKAAFVGEELASEYMSKMIAGSSTDSMLRGFDGFTRTVVDRALLSNNEGFLRRTAQSLGLGSKPVESLLFNNLQEASPALNAQLRDMVRMRRNMDKKLELADEVQVTNIQKKDLSNPVAAQLAVEMNIAEKGADGVTRMKLDDVMSQEDKVSLDSLKSVIKSTPVADVNAPRMRELDGKIVGDGISNAQLAAIQSSPNILDKVKQSFALIKSAIENGEVLYIRNGKATKKITSRLTGKTLTRYNDGVRMTERDGVPYSLAENKAGELYLNLFDISKARRNAMDLASKDRLGPYQADFQAFYGDLVRYLNNLSDPVNRVPSKELLGDAEKAAYLTDFFGQKEGDGKASKFIRSLTLDRMVEMRPTGERVRMTELAYDLNKARFMPAENLGETKVFDAPDTGFRIIAKGNKHSLYAPTGERLGIYDTQAGAEKKANQINFKQSTEQSRFMPENKVVAALPRRNKASAKDVSYDDQGNIKFRNKEPKDWTPEDFEEYGKGFGVENLGPLSPIRKVTSELAGSVATIPGGLDGKFTYYDLLWLKANPVDVAKMSEGVHAQLTAKLARTMAPEPANAVQKFNGIVFGMLSPNAPLLPNEFAAARLRFESMDDIRRFAKLQPENPTAENTTKLNVELKRLLGMTSAGKGGLGIGITADLSYIVNAARLFLKKPEFFIKRADESWGTFVDKVSTQVKGLGTKTASFGSVWQDPLNASISAIDRHMARIFGQELLADKQMRTRFESIVVKKFNSLLSEAKNISNKLDRKIAKTTSEKERSKLEQEKTQKLASLPDPTAVRSKTLDDVLGQAEIFGEERVRSFVNEAVFAAMGGREGKFITAEGTVNPKAPENIKAIEWVETPQKFKVMSETYRAALEMNAKRAKELGVEVFPAQWTLWDRIRQRVEPHEVMFPGLEKLPALNDRQLGAAFEANKVAGYGITPDQGQTWRRSAVNSPSALAYFMPDDAKNLASPNANPNLPSKNARLTRTIPKSRFYVVSDERGRDFADAIARTAKEHPRGAAVTVKPAEFYYDPENFLYLSEDGLAGAAVKSDGDLVSVFKHPASTARMQNILTDATAASIKLDAFDIAGFLPNYYSNFGFRPVARIAWSDDFAPPRWNFETMGRPDVVVMVKDADNVLGLPDAKVYNEAARQKVPLVDYEQAVQIQSNAVAKLKAAGKTPVNYMPDGGSTMPEVKFSSPEKLPNGQAWSTNMNYRVIQKTGGKYRVYAPTGALIGVEDTLEKSKKLIAKKSPAL